MFLGINSRLLRLEFLSGCLPFFLRSTKCFMNRFEFSCIVDFFVRIIKTIDEYVHLSNSDFSEKGRSNSRNFENKCPHNILHPKIEKATWIYTRHCVLHYHMNNNIPSDWRTTIYFYFPSKSLVLLDVMFTSTTYRLKKIRFALPLANAWNMVFQTLFITY